MSEDCILDPRGKPASEPLSPARRPPAFEGYDVSARNGLLAPANTPDAIIAEIYADVLKVPHTREFSEQLQNQGMDLAPMNPTEFKNHFAAEVAK